MSAPVAVAPPMSVSAPQSPEEILAAVFSALQQQQQQGGGGAHEALAIVSSAELHVGPWDAAALEVGSVHLLLFLFEGDVEGARFLVRRSQAPLPVQGLYEHLWRGDTAAFFELARTLNVSPRVAALVRMLVAKKRADQAELVAKAYKAIAATAACALLGLQATELAAFCAQHGWALAADGFVEPRRADAATQLPAQPLQQNLARDLELLVAHAVFLENEIGTHISNKPAARQA